MPVGRCEHFVYNNDLKYLHISTENKNIRKNTNWSVTTQRLALRSNDDDGGPDSGYSGLSRGT